MKKIYNLIHPNNHIYMVNRNFIRVGATFSLLGENIFDGSDKVAKILASTDKSLGLPLLPNIEEDIEMPDRSQIIKLAKTQNFNGQIGTIIPQEKAFLNGYEKGYKAASTKKYTEEDIRKAIIFGFEQCLNNETISPDGSGETGIFEKDIKPFIESLNPLPKQVEIEMKMEFITTEDDQNDPIGHFWIPKVDANNIVQVVKWIYE